MLRRLLWSLCWLRGYHTSVYIVRTVDDRLKPTGVAGACVDCGALMPAGWNDDALLYVRWPT